MPRKIDWNVLRRTALLAAAVGLPAGASAATSGNVSRTIAGLPASVTLTDVQPSPLGNRSTTFTAQINSINTIGALRVTGTNSFFGTSWNWGFVSACTNGQAAVGNTSPNPTWGYPQVAYAPCDQFGSTVKIHYSQYAVDTL